MFSSPLLLSSAHGICQDSALEDRPHSPDAPLFDVITARLLRVLLYQTCAVVGDLGLAWRGE